MVEREGKGGGKMTRTRDVNRVRRIKRNKKPVGKLKQTDKQTKKTPHASANHKEAKGSQRGPCWCIQFLSWISLPTIEARHFEEGFWGHSRNFHIRIS